MGVWQQLENEFWGRVPTPRKYRENVLFSFGRICQTRQVGMDDMREGMRKASFLCSINRLLCTADGP